MNLTATQREIMNRYIAHVDAHEAHINHAGEMLTTEHAHPHHAVRLVRDAIVETYE